MKTIKILLGVVFLFILIKGYTGVVRYPDEPTVQIVLKNLPEDNDMLIREGKVNKEYVLLTTTENEPFLRKGVEMIYKGTLFIYLFFFFLLLLCWYLLKKKQSGRMVKVLFIVAGGLLFLKCFTGVVTLRDDPTVFIVLKYNPLTENHLVNSELNLFQGEKGYITLWYDENQAFWQDDLCAIYKLPLFIYLTLFLLLIYYYKKKQQIIPTGDL
ncbi:MAG: hypothetical protein LUG98_06960 [Tannerellaceae bacterium]|nr:hypothetical protein [Tannerellaceae bacterium]